MNIVAAVDNNWAIGNKGELLVSIPNDQKSFRLLTTGKVVVLGRKTLDTFPQKQPLPNRTNIILSRDKNFKVKGAVVVNSVGELMEYLKPYKSEDIYIIGGESIYEQLLPYCDTAHITAIDYEYEADTYLKNLDEDPEWVKTADSDEITYFDLSYSFVKYERVKKSKKQS
ncbi:MAG: dihydrofolate reductase [Lachnospiraceae bacterium]|nr:dihydrofolate reductase [Lachnospiraceae bacterium]